MTFFNFNEFVNEDEKVRLQRELREYKLKHVSDDHFQVKSKDLYKEFSILPYKSESLDKLKIAHKKLVDSIDVLHPIELYNAIEYTEKIDYKFGNVFPSKISLKNIPSLSMNLEDNVSKELEQSQHKFLVNSFSTLPKEIRDDIKQYLLERAELYCIVIEALFYYIRLTDKDQFYEGKSTDELLKEYENLIQDASTDISFSFKGPFSDSSNEHHLEDDSLFAFWKCEKDKKEFYIRATVNTKELYSEKHIGGTEGIKFSLGLIGNNKPLKDFSFFDVKNLKSSIETLLKKFLSYENN